MESMLNNHISQPFCFKIHYDHILTEHIEFVDGWKSTGSLWLQALFCRQISTYEFMAEGVVHSLDYVHVNFHVLTKKFPTRKPVPLQRSSYWEIVTPWDFQDDYYVKHYL